VHERGDDTRKKNVRQRGRSKVCPIVRENIRRVGWWCVYCGWCTHLRRLLDSRRERNCRRRYGAPTSNSRVPRRPAHRRRRRRRWPSTVPGRYPPSSSRPPRPRRRQRIRVPWSLRCTAATEIVRRARHHGRIAADALLNATYARYGARRRRRPRHELIATVTASSHITRAYGTRRESVNGLVRTITAADNSDLHCFRTKTVKIHGYNDNV